MRWFALVTAVVLVWQPCACRPAEEESVVSVYTTLPTAGTNGPHLDVYRQIADNIAERITQPIFRFFGLGNSTAHEEKTTKRPFEHIELDSSENTSKTGKNGTKSSTDTKTEMTNEIPKRDVEELSVESLQKSDKKPEKITLFSSYLQVKEKLEANDMKNETEGDNSLELDDVDSDDLELDDDKDEGSSPRVVYIFELMASIIQLLWGGFLAIFKPPASSDSS